MRLRRTASWAAAMALLILAGCPSPGARPAPSTPGPGSPGVGAPFGSGAGPAAPPPANEDPAAGIARAAARVPGAGRVLAVVVGNAALVALQVNSPGAAGAPPPAAGLGGYDPSFDQGGPGERPPVSSDGHVEDRQIWQAERPPVTTDEAIRDDQPPPAPPGRGIAPQLSGGIPREQVQDEVARVIRQSYPYIVDIRFARTQQTAAELAPIVEATRNGQPLVRFLSRLAELAGRMEPAPAAGDAGRRQIGGGSPAAAVRRRQSGDLLPTAAAGLTGRRRPRLW